jgi:DNA-binding SARP family transcriptional activator
MPGVPQVEEQASMNELTSKAAEAEKTDLSAAIKIYSHILEKDPLQTHAYDRLMILYRKEKNYKKELSIINSGIKTFEKFYKAQSGKPSKKISEISKKLNKAFHLVDKKGNALYAPEPIDRWQKRKKVVEKKMGK